MVTQFAHIARYFYHSLGIAAKILFWGVPLSLLNGFYLSRSQSISEFSLACIVGAVPTLFVYPSCFELASRVMPEIGEIHSFAVKSKIWRWFSNTAREYLRKTIQ